MLIARRNMMGGKALPYDAEVEWLSANGVDRQYVDTGLQATINTEILGEAKINQYVQYTPLFGGVAGNSVSGGCIKLIAADSHTIYGYVMALSSTPNCKSLRADIGVKSMFRVWKGGFSINGLESGLTGGMHIESSQNISVFGYANDTRVTYNTIYWFKIVENGVTVRYFKPVVKNGIGYLYDECGSICPVTGSSLYPNFGTGSFAIGPSKTGNETY